jgi:cellulase/cellobiase CelA1
VPAGVTAPAGAGAAAAEVQTTSAAFNFKVLDDWGTGFVAVGTLVNNDARNLSDWRVDFDFPYQITNIWNATISSHVGNHYTISPAAWNSVVGPSGSVTFGFQGSPGGVQSSPTNVVISSGATPPPAPAL